MITDLLNKVGTIDADNLIVGADPALRIGAAKIRKGAGALARGTMLAKSAADGLLVVLGAETAEAYAVLADDVTVPDDEDITADIYIGGKFNGNKIVLADGYEMTEDDKDALRRYGIEIAAAASAD